MQTQLINALEELYHACVWYCSGGQILMGIFPGATRPHTSFCGLSNRQLCTRQHALKALMLVLLNCRHGRNVLSHSTLIAICNRIGNNVMCTLKSQEMAIRGVFSKASLSSTRAKTLPV